MSYVRNEVRWLCVAFLLCLSAWGQTDQGRIVGTVTDSQGAVIPGATVMSQNEKTGDQRTATSNNQGRYVITGLAPGSYSLTAKAEGLGPSQVDHLSLGVGQERNLNIVLNPAAVETQVTVDGGDMVMIDTSSARIGVNVGAREVGSVPLNGRQLSQLYLMAPGAVTAGGGTYDNIRFSGRANQQNAVRFDGVDGTSIIDSSPGNLNGESSSFFRLQTSLENIQEFRVESSNYPAEYGTGSGGQISVITKSGSNEFHGSLFEYLRNSALDARNFFDGASKSPLRLNQFGGSLGGPVKKGKVFFFASYEGLRQRVGVPLIEAVPSAAARLRAVPSIQPLLAAFPNGTVPTDNPDFAFASLNSPLRVDENSGGIRLDFKLGEKYSAYARYFRDHGESFQPLGVSGNGVLVTAAPQNAVLGVQQLLSSTVINETKFGFNGSKTRGWGFAPAVPGVDMSSISLSITGSVALPGIGGQGGSAGVATPGGLVRANSATNGRGQPYTNYSLSFIDNLTWIRGNHTMKFGAEARPLRMYTDRLGGTTYTFSNLNDFLANRPSQIQFLGDLSAPSPFNGGATGIRLAKQTYYIGYAQDEWKLRPTLTMSYGLRYEYYTVLHEDRNLAIVMDTVNGGLKPSDSPFYQASKANFGPRLAFSWSPARLNNKTVLRIGSGFYYGPGQTEDQIQPIESDRVSTTLPPGSAYPIDPAAIIASYDINSPTLRFQPRAYAPGYRIPERILSYTASLQQELPGGTVLTLAYVGSQGRNLFLRGITNRIVSVGTNPTTGAAVIAREFGDRFAEVDFKTSGGTDHYDALQMTVNRRLSRGVSLGSQWTWSHSIGNTAGSNEARTAQDSTNFDGERGNNNFDVRHSLNFNVLYSLPFGTGRRYLNNCGPVADLLLGGWEIGSVLNARTGLPLEVLLTRNDVAYRDSRNGAIVNNPILVDGVPATTAVINTPGGGASRGIRRPDLVPGVDPYLRGPEKTRFLNPAAFAMPSPGAYGNLARNAVHGPGLVQLDLTLQKRFLLSEKKRLEFRAEFYNVLNRANFANPPATLANALGTGANQLQPGQPFTAAAAGGSFGVVRSTVEKTVGLGTNRQIQVSLRLNF